MEPLLAYFQGEKQAGIACFVLGVLSAGAATATWQRWARARPAAIALGAVGLLQLALGAALMLGTDGRVQGLISLVGRSEGAAWALERARMEGVAARFVIFEAVEVGLIGLGFAGLGTLRRRPRLAPAFVALGLEAAVMLAFDRLAADRAATYLAWLHTLG